MSAFAGYFFREEVGEIEARDLLSRLRRATDQESGSLPHVESIARRFAVLKFDPGTFCSSGVVHEPGEKTVVVAGHPYAEAVSQEARIAHVVALADGLAHDGVIALSATRGSFALAAYLERTGRLILSSDFLGVRPLYYAASQPRVLFATNFRLLCRLGAEVTKERDQKAALELAVLGFPLRDGTFFSGIRRVEGGRALTFDSRSTNVERFWNGETLAVVEPTRGESELREKTRRTFLDAVARRLSLNERRVLAFLSGGMDSRAVVAALRRLGTDVETMNFARTGSQDLMYGRAAAEKLQTCHLELPWEGGGGAFDKSEALLPQWRQRILDAGRRVERVHLVWSGDGGSVTLGHVYISDVAVAKIRAGDDRGAIDQLADEQHWRVPTKMLRRNWRANMKDQLRTSLYNGLNRIQSSDAGRRLHVLLMLAEQAHHMDDYFEAIYRHRTEVQMPFFDRKFVESVLTSPAEPFLRHHLYNSWLAELSAAAVEVPWQVYPGHEPAPHASDDSLGFQWSPTLARQMHATQRRAILRDSWRASRGPRFAASGLSRSSFLLAWFLTALRVKDLTYALRFAHRLAEGPAPIEE